MQVYGHVGRSPLPLSSSGNAREGSRRIPAAEARLMKEAGTIVDASFTTTSGGWIMPFSVLEEKTTGLRRRWIAWPREKKRDDPYEAYAPLLHIFHYLPPVMAEAASCVELKASFLRVFTAGDSASLSMPRGGRHAGGADTAPNGIQGRPRNSPDYYFGNCGGDDGGSPPLGCTFIGAYRRMDR
ncbi:TcC31.12 [Trypanosoma cruzi]|uniref:TcC31.12 n=1 Tax=Trypanosoma cruzi TaxID=5693 RepID=A0A2V2VPX0_TRYCR|nr:TcC31.12 [Trypanosoma cruzi]